MTQLGVADTQIDRLAGGLVAKVKWSLVVPWAVSVLLAAGPVYHRFLNMEEGRTEDRKDIKELTKQVGELSRAVDVLNVKVDTLSKQLADERSTRRR